jgi:hypothetical protein
MQYSQKNIDLYFKMYPDLQKWVNSCPFCGARGRKPEMPDAIGGGHSKIAANNVRKMLPVLEVDASGFCLTCSRVYHRQK